MLNMGKDKQLNDSILKITNFIKKEINFKTMIKNTGIYETKPLAKLNDGSNITIGVCCEDAEDYEDKTSKERYYYNIFVGEEYIDLDNSYGYKDNLIPKETIQAILKEISFFA